MQVGNTCTTQTSKRYSQRDVRCLALAKIQMRCELAFQNVSDFHTWNLLDALLCSTPLRTHGSVYTAWSQRGIAFCDCAEDLEPTAICFALLALHRRVMVKHCWSVHMASICNLFVSSVAHNTSTMFTFGLRGTS